MRNLSGFCRCRDRFEWSLLFVAIIWHCLTLPGTLESKQEEAELNMKRELEQLAQDKNDFEKKKKVLKKKKSALEQMQATLPMLNLQVADNKNQLESFKLENKRHVATLNELKQEVDIFIAKYLRQEGVEQGKKDELSGLVGEIKDEESDIAQWSAEEHKQNKTVAMLSAQREIKAREASRAIQNEKETKEVWPSCSSRF